MPPVVRTARDLLRRPAGWVPTAVVAAGGALLVLLPLFELPGLELGLAVSALCALLGGWMGAGAANELRKTPRPSVPRTPLPGPATAAARAVAAATLLLWAAAAVPFLAAVLRAVLTTRCSPFSQAGFFPLLVAPTAFLAAAGGVFCRTAFPQRGRAVGLYALLVIASVAWTVWPLVRGPQIFAFNFFFGLFPGPLYDEALHLPAAVGWFRLETLLWAAVLTTCAAAIFPAPGATHPRHRTRVLTTLVILALGITALEMAAVPLGFRSTDAAVRAALGGRTETEHAEILYPREKPPEDVERLRRDVEFRLFQLARFFGAPPASVRVYVFRSPEETKKLRPGDIYTHMYSGLRNEQDPTTMGPSKAFIEGRKRGIFFDTGTGGGSFKFSLAVPMVKDGFIPDSISTDLHIGSMNGATKDELNVASKMMAIGLSLKEAVAEMTSHPAREIKHEELGNLSVGSVADVAVLRLEEGHFGFTDMVNGRVDGTKKLVDELTIKDGKIVYDLNGMEAAKWDAAPDPNAVYGYRWSAFAPRVRPQPSDNNRH